MKPTIRTSNRLDSCGDGTRIVFGTDRDGNAEIYVMSADGSAQTNLTNAPTSGEAPGYPNGWR